MSDVSKRRNGRYLRVTRNCKNVISLHIFLPQILSTYLQYTVGWQTSKTIKTLPVRKKKEQKNQADESIAYSEIRPLPPANEENRFVQRMAEMSKGIYNRLSLRHQPVKHCLFSLPSEVKLFKSWLQFYFQGIKFCL